MNTLPNLKKELDQEYQITKKFFELYPEDKGEYAPHEKSMKLQPLANHIAEIVGWPDYMVKSEQLDFAAGDYQPNNVVTKSELLALAEKGYSDSKATLESLSEEDLDNRWVMRNGEHVIADMSKYEAIRHALSQLTHHRAQLGVYYRLNDIALPGTYGPSADSMES